MSNDEYFSILAAICLMRFASKLAAFVGWSVFIGLAVAYKMGWLS